MKCFVVSGIEEDELPPLHGVPIYNLRKIHELRRDEPIIIASGWYYKLLAKQLISEGFTPDSDFFVWQRYTDKFCDRDAFVKHNLRVWKNYLPKNPQNKVLIFRTNNSGAGLIDMSYFSNYLARKYNAEILGFGSKFVCSKGIYNEVYSSFNVNRNVITNDYLSEEQELRAYEILYKIWSSLKTKYDWLNICIDGIDLGEDICSQYMRTWQNGNFGDDGSEDNELKLEKGLPVYNLHTDKLKRFLLSTLKEMVFWQDYFSTNKNIKALLLYDGVYREGIAKKIAIKNNVDVYHVHANFSMKLNHFKPGNNFRYYKEFFDSLTEEDKKIGIQWAKERLAARLKGDSGEISYMEGISAFNNTEMLPVLEKNDKIKVLICPHCLYDNPYGYGKFLFADHWDWLCYLGSLTLKTDYDWYLKVHPAATKIDKDNLKRLVKIYPKIKLLPEEVSALQLKREGIDFALTIWGTIGHEYPAMGIQVINAGNNPHMAFDFCWNPKTREEYEYLLNNLDKLHKKVDMDEIYQFYCIHFLYLSGNEKKICYKNDKLLKKLIIRDDILSSIRYTDFLAEWSPERHAEILENVAKRIEILDKYKDGEFLREEQEIIDSRLSRMTAPPPVWMLM